jgi:hypothetical protein
MFKCQEKINLKNDYKKEKQRMTGICGGFIAAKFFVGI